MLSLYAFIVTLSASGNASSLATITDATSPPSGWVVVPPPTTDREWLCANYSDDLRIENTGEGIQVFRGVLERAPAVKRSGGALVGVNRGEFGGAIEWHVDGVKTAAIVTRDNPIAFVTEGARVFAFAGLAHLTIDEGHVLELKQTGDKWSSKKILDLGSAPDAVLSRAGGEVVVLTTTGLLSVDLDKVGKRRLFHNSNWAYLYANSIAQLSGSVFVGARGAVIRLRPDKKGYVEEWWVDSRCPRRVGDKCECHP
jgi:hypothetical protein